MKEIFDESKLELILFGSDVLTTSSGSGNSDDTTISADDLGNSMTDSFGKSENF